MNERIEIRWHGRGGQGAKTASLLLADVAFSQGLYVQGFPEYGPERMGAPITAYTRLSSNPIRVHSNIYEPDFVAVMDETLIGPVDVTSGLKEDGAIVVNTSKEPAEIAALLKGYKGKIYTVDAASISLATIGRNIPNTPMLAAVVKVSGAMDKEAFFDNMRNSFSHKFASKPEVVDGNMKALKMSMDGVNVYER
ncbi:MAG: 2-oxoacid:acceptor oxidoreductase family protein [Spirochaetales bacterium]|nr:2-oxoacid:acceptor oxidoreductase family protein [Spirochaetales bacterium]